MKAEDIFAVDLRTWNRVCDFGINAAVAYLVMARGTGGDNRTTSWSTNAIEKYTSISRPRAKASVALLVKGGLVDLLQQGSKPRYRLVPPEHIVGTSVGLTREEDEVINFLNGRTLEEPKCCKSIASKMEREGRVELSFATAALTLSKPEWIWLPNTIVDGLSKEVPPVELLRQTQNISALRLFINLYASHHLATDGGVEWRDSLGIRHSFDRLKIFEYGEWDILSFSTPKITANPRLPAVRCHMVSPEMVQFSTEKKWESFWQALTLLRTSGLADAVTHLVDGTGPEAEIIHPMPFGVGEPTELRIAKSATEMCRRMLPATARLSLASYSGVAPIRRHMENATVIGIYRLKYRPSTRATSIWLAEAHASFEKWISLYDLQHQGDLKVG